MATNPDVSGSFLQLLLYNKNFYPPPLYIALYTASWVTTTESNYHINLAGSEVSGGGYIRMSASQTQLEEALIATNINQNIYSENFLLNKNWIVGSGIGYNTAQIKFPIATTDWGYVAYVGLVSSSIIGEGIIYFYSKLSPSLLVNNGYKVSIPTGGLLTELSLKEGPTGTQQRMIYNSSNKLLNYIYNREFYFKPGMSLYLVFYNELPSITGSGGREISGSVGYERKRIAGPDEWQSVWDDSNRRAYLSASIMHVQDATEDWGHIEGGGLMITSGSHSGDEGELLLISKFEGSLDGMDVTVITGDSFHFVNDSDITVYL